MNYYVDLTVLLDRNVGDVDVIFYDFQMEYMAHVIGGSGTFKVDASNEWNTATAVLGPRANSLHNLHYYSPVSGKETRGILIC